MPSDLTDEALLDRFKITGDDELFRQLVRRYENRIYNAAYKMLGDTDEADDVVQETCIKLHQNLLKFRKEASFAAWIFRIAHNACMDKLRTRRRKKRIFQFLSFSSPSSPVLQVHEEAALMMSQLVDQNPDPSQQLDLAEQGEVVAQKLAMLPENQRAVVVLHDIEGFSYQEIAKIVGTSLGTVRSRLHYGRTKLKELLQPYFSSLPSSR